MVNLDSVFEVANLTPIAKGGRRNVYALPDDPRLLLKVEQSHNPMAPKTALRRWIRDRYPLTKYRFLISEMKQDMRLTLKLGAEAPHGPLARTFGLVQTDLGPGSLTEAVRADDGTLGPTLREMARGANPVPAAEWIDPLTDFARAMFDHQIVATDLHDGNIVHGRRNGRLMFCLVDGHGDRNVIPLRTYVRWANDRNLHNRMRALARKIRIAWDAEARRFHA